MTRRPATWRKLNHLSMATDVFKFKHKQFLLSNVFMLLSEAPQAWVAWGSLRVALRFPWSFLRVALGYPQGCLGAPSGMPGGSIYYRSTSTHILLSFEGFHSCMRELPISWKDI